MEKKGREEEKDEEEEDKETEVVVTLLRTWLREMACSDVSFTCQQHLTTINYLG